MNLEAKPQPEQSNDIYDDDAICDYSQSGERILGPRNLQALRSHHPGARSNVGF
jgi:hypothetical protein